MPPLAIVPGTISNNDAAAVPLASEPPTAPNSLLPTKSVIAHVQAMHPLRRLGPAAGAGLLLLIIIILFLWLLAIASQPRFHPRRNCLMHGVLPVIWQVLVTRSPPLLSRWHSAWGPFENQLEPKGCKEAGKCERKARKIPNLAGLQILGFS